MGNGLSYLDNVLGGLLETAELLADFSNAFGRMIESLAHSVVRTLEAARLAVDVARELASKGVELLLNESQAFRRGFAAARGGEEGG